MYIWKVLVLEFFNIALISFISKVYISQFFSPKSEFNLFYFSLNEHTSFLWALLFHSVADIIYIRSQG